MSKLEKKKHIPEVVEVVTLLEENRLNVEIDNLKQQSEEVKYKIITIRDSIKQELKEEIVKAQSNHTRALKDNANFLKTNMGIDLQEEEEINYSNFDNYFEFPSEGKLETLKIPFSMDEKARKTKLNINGFPITFAPFDRFSPTGGWMHFQFVVPKKVTDSFEELKQLRQLNNQNQELLNKKRIELAKLDDYSKKVKLVLKIEDLKSSDSGKKILDQAKQIIAEKNINAVIKKSIE